MRRVVVTGMAPVCSLGTNADMVFYRICKKEIAVAEISKNTELLKKMKTSFYTPIVEIDDSRYDGRLHTIKRKAKINAYLAGYAALEALADGGIDKVDEDAMVIIGTSVPLIQDVINIHKTYIDSQKIELMSVPSMMVNSLVSWVSILLGIHGGSMLVSSACASGTESIGYGYEKILMGKTDMAICGACDYMLDDVWLCMKGFEKLKVISSSPDGKSYPFSEERSGFLFSEGGAGILILEELEHALRRNAKIYAEITGFEMNCDGYSIISMPEDGENIVSMMKRLIGDKKVDYYNAHGTGTRLNDLVESRVIQRVFGTKLNQPAINSSKAFLGHTLAASGALEAIICVESILNNRVHGNICKTVMEDLNLKLETREMDVNCAVSASFGFGGHNAALMIERYNS
jgi:3-oxoacyl-[acyl-carrier-protein] synthase II